MMSTSETAICAPTRSCRVQTFNRPVSRDPLNHSSFGCLNAGASPKSSPQSREAKIPNRRTRLSSEAVVSGGMPSGAMATNACSRA